MATMDDTNEDSWLYGDSNAEAAENTEETKKETSADKEEISKEQSGDIGETASEQAEQAEEPPTLSEAPTDTEEPSSETAINGVSDPSAEPAADANGEAEAAEDDEKGEGTQEEDGRGDVGESSEEDSDDDDDIQVTIGDIKTATTYTAINLKRGLVADKAKQPGKFSIEEFEAVGTINGVPAHEFNLDNLEDKPWRKPGADITDYFNYGFNEDTWRAYCERQKRIRVQESGVGMGTLGGMTKQLVPGAIPVTIVNDNSKYSGIAGLKKAGPPPGRKMAGAIDVIGGNPGSSRRSLEKGANATTTPTPATEPQENPIQVMTADRREYGGRPKPGFPDLSIPPPQIPPFDMPPPQGMPLETISTYTGGGGGYENNEFYSSEPDYYQSYEPTQDSQWGTQPWEGGSGPSGPPPETAATSVVIPLGSDSDNRPSKSSSSTVPPVEIKEEIVPEKEKSETKHKEKHRHRSRSRSAERTERSSRSGKKRNKSRSRSPHRHRSKKKSRRSEREESE